MLQQLYYSAVVKVEWSFDVCLLILILYMWRLISVASLCLSLPPSVGYSPTISGEVTFDSDQMTLTCISTGGPATTVTWTRDSITVDEGTETVLDDPVFLSLIGQWDDGQH